MAKHLIDIDEEALRGAKATLGSKTIKDTVNAALRRASGDHSRKVHQRLEALANAELVEREQAWR
jgi:Arc/MetJ family transcription regulator